MPPVPSAPVWRHCDQAGLDEQYNSRRRDPGRLYFRHQQLKPTHHFDALLEWADPASAVFAVQVGLIKGEGSSSNIGGQWPPSAP